MLNEYSIWAVQDKHSRAFTALTGDMGKRIARNLGIQSALSKKCLPCHTLDIPEDQKARTFDIRDGVSCENCHGPASKWLGPHTARDWDYRKSLELGMYDTRDLVSRNEKCLSCHLGDATKTVDHEMIAAGHPDLYFEIESFSSVEPRHWKEGFSEDAAIEIRDLAIGQAVQLREWLRRVSRDASRSWPEYAVLDCIACHHTLTAAKDSWRQERGYAGRKPGNPPWNASRFAVLETIAHQTEAGAASELDREVARVNELVSDTRGNRAQISAAATEAANTADKLVHALTTVKLDSAASLQLIAGICADSERIANRGERAAEQAAMAVNALFVAYERARKPRNSGEVHTALNDLYKQFDDPSNYNPLIFARSLRHLGTLIKEVS